MTSTTDTDIRFKRTLIEGLLKGKGSWAMFATLAQRLQIEARDDIPTAGTDGVKLAYNPSFIDSLGEDELRGLIAHEVLHVALGHPDRRGGRDPMTWNIACDEAINRIVRQAGLTLPEGAIDLLKEHPDWPADLPAEGYYDLLCQQQDQDQDQDQNGQGQNGQDGDQDQDGQGQDQNQNGQDPGEKGDMDTQGDEDGGEAEGGDSGYRPGSGGAGTPGPGKWVGEVWDRPQGDQEQATGEDVESKVAAMAAVHAALKANPGDADWLGEICSLMGADDGSVDWAAELSDFISHRVPSGDYSWTRPSRRGLGLGMSLPGPDGESLGAILVAVDVSGSISAPELQAFAGEVQGILEITKSRATIVYHSNRIKRIQEWEPGEGDLELSAPTGGGTSHVCVQEHLRTMDEMPDAIVALTDGYSRWGDHADWMGVPVLAALTDGDCPMVPSQVKKVTIDINRKKGA